MKKRVLATLLTITLLFPNQAFAEPETDIDSYREAEVSDETDSERSGGDTRTYTHIERDEEMYVSETATVSANDVDFVKPPLNYHGENDQQVSSIQESMPQAANGENSLPEVYTSPYITSVKNQNPYGTCWAFGLVAASEASILRENLADKETLDLSELQLAYFTYHTVTDPLGGTKGDYFINMESDFLDVGGNLDMTTRRVATWQGLTMESEVPYTDASPSLVLDDAAAYSKDAFHLENSYRISMLDRDIVKQNIMDFGAGAVAYCDEDLYFNTDTEGYECTYNPYDEATNHIITIVGWDDSYSKENFGHYKPASDGAWLCKNSWGEYFSSGGYFWISYEDVTANTQNIFFYDYGKADNYDFNYQYDGGVADYYRYYPKNGYGADMYGANIYTSTSNQTLKAIGFYTRDISYESDIYIYVDCDSNNPASGELVTVQAANELYSGFHTVTLNEPVYLSQGTRFSVVIKHHGEEGEYRYFAVDESNEYSWCASYSTSEKGQSFISGTGNGWYDLAALDINCRIKAYTDIETAVKVTGITLNNNAATIPVQSTLELSTAKVVPSNAADKTVNWTSSNTAVATVNEAGVVTAVSPGKAVITCKAKDGSRIRAYCDITVTQPVTGITLNKTSARIGINEKLNLDESIQPLNATNKAVIWSSSNSSVASVNANGEVTGLSSGTSVIKCTANDGSGKYATCNVTVEIQTGDVLYDAKTKSSYKVTGTASNKKTVTFVSAASGAKSVKIPNTVVLDKVTYKVTTIGKNAFKNNKKLTTVTIGKNVTSIESNAFYKCTKLKKITIPAKVQKIGSKAFYGCKNLKNITIKSTKLTSKRVGSKAFKGIHKKATIKVPKSKLKNYKKLLKAKGVGSKVTIKK